MERLTITLTAEMAEAVRSAVSEGDYASSSEIIREALRDWQLKRNALRQELEALRAKIGRGDLEIAAGHVRDFDAERIIEAGGRKLAGRASSG
ncbi:MAG: ribbon-helix-helix protein, CopG family [Alphaproteobacteria bacterium]|nr:ribbon-helix-helix protein, CopG family [Alphaproteobacteria bacterium]